jgi:hypothetical protein
MKKILTVLLLVFWMASPEGARGLDLQKRTADFEATASIDRTPPIIGENKLSLQLKGADGKPITQAQILVNYYMPPMPRMAPMNYTTPASFKGNAYRTSLYLIMEGPWYIVFKITLNGKTSSVKFNINVS